MKSITIKSEGYTYSYEFKPVMKNEAFDKDVLIPVEDNPSPSMCLHVCLELLRCAFGHKKVREALLQLGEIDY